METGKERGAATTVWRAAGRLMAIVALLVLGLFPAVRATAQTDEETYESPQYGYTLTYDADEWEVVQEDEDEDDPYDALYLGNGTSNVALIGDPDYDDTDLDDCVDDYLGGMEENDAFSDIEPYDERGAEGEDDDRVWASFTYTFEFDDGEEDDFTRYLECRALGDGLTLVTIHDARIDDYEDEVSAREDLLDGFEGPDTSADDEEDEDNDRRGSRTGNSDDDDDPEPDDRRNDEDDAEVVDGRWEGETEDGEPFSLTILDGGVSAVSYSYECNGDPIFASSSVSDPAPIEDGEFEFATETSSQSTTVVGTFAGGEAEGTLIHETDDEDGCDVELDWTVEEP